MLDFSKPNLWEHLQSTDKPIVLYGMGNGADSIISRLDAQSIPHRGVFVSDGFVRDKLFHGHKLISYDDAKAQFGDMIVLVSFGSSLPDVLENMMRIAAEQELYAPYVPVIGDGDFNRKYVTEHYHDFIWVHDRLSDPLSRRTYENILKYRYSGDISYLSACETDDDEIFSLLHLQDNSTFMDLGAYRGDTVAEFVRYCPNYNRIYALEPDRKTFDKLCQNTASLHDMHVINAAAYSHSHGVEFAMRSGRNSLVSKSGCTVPSRSIDEILLPDEHISLIKMDIEGAEIPAIEGAERTIKIHKPKMRISCYHRIDDLFAIPKKVLSIQPDYKLYMRHRAYVPDWDTEFIFI